MVYLFFWRAIEMDTIKQKQGEKEEREGGWRRIKIEILPSNGTWIQFAKWNGIYWNSDVYFHSHYCSFNRIIIFHILWVKRNVLESVEAKFAPKSISKCFKTKQTQIRHFWGMLMYLAVLPMGNHCICI